MRVFQVYCLLMYLVVCSDVVAQEGRLSLGLVSDVERLRYPDLLGEQHTAWYVNPGIAVQYAMAKRVRLSSGLRYSPRKLRHNGPDRVFIDIPLLFDLGITRGAPLNLYFTMGPYVSYLADYDQATDGLREDTFAFHYSIGFEKRFKDTDFHWSVNPYMRSYFFTKNEVTTGNFNSLGLSVVVVRML